MSINNNQRDSEIDREVWWLNFIGNTMIVALIGVGVAACAAVIKFL